MAKSKKSSFRGKVSSNAQATKNAGSNYGYLKLPKGLQVYQPVPGAKEKFDILPYVVTSSYHPDKNEEVGIAVKGELWYKRPFRVHKNVGVDKDTVVCLSSFGKKCPICEYRKKRAAEGADKDELKELNASQRNLYAIIPIGNKKFENKVHIFDFSQHLFQNLLVEELEENEDYEVFPDLEEGLTLQVRWTEETFNGHKYAEAGRIDFLERKEGYDEEILEEVPSLDELLQEYTYAELEAKFLELADESVEEYEEEEERPRKSKSTKKVVEDEEDEEEEEEEEEAPRKPTAKPVKKAPKLEWADLKEMDADELFEVVESQGLDIDIDAYEEEADLRDVVAEELGIEKPAKKTTKPIAAKEEEKPEKAEKPTKSGALVCPDKKGTFGKSTDTLDACDDCPLWSKCIDKKEEEE